MTTNQQKTLADFGEVFSSDEFLNLYRKLWDKRLENSVVLSEKEQEQVAFAHWAINQDIQNFFIKPCAEAQALLAKEAA